MKRMVAVLTVLSLVLMESAALGQWMFFPPQAAETAGRQLGRAAARLPHGGASPAASPMTGAVPTAPPPAPADSGWDQSGIIGRQDRDAAWRHEERMTGIDAYWRGVQDGINALRPVWGPYPPLPPGPLYQKAPAGKPPAAPGGWRKP